MISIYATTDYIDQIKASINTKERLDELVEVHDMMQDTPVSAWSSLVVNSEGVKSLMDWANMAPPYFHRTIPFSQDTLLAMIAVRLQNMDWIQSLELEDSLRQDLINTYCLQQGLAVSLSEDEAWPSTANNAFMMHYGNCDQEVTAEKLMDQYQKAIDQAPTEEEKAFVAMHYAGLQMDLQHIDAAITTLLPYHDNANVSQAAKYGIKTMLNQAWMSQLQVPYDQQLLLTIQANMNECVEYYAAQNMHVDEALLLMDGTQIASINGKYTESLRYISRAIQLFESEQLDDLANEGKLKKAHLLYTWAQAGNPQFYRSALQEYQKCLKIFNKDNAPGIYAEIQHHMAILYVEMPKEESKEGIWAGVANSAFQEALQYYTKEQYPYEYAMICNNFGNAVSKFPVTANSDNYAKAIKLYNEALEVRDQSMPYERAISIMNFLEASWYAGNEEEQWNEERYNDMVAKAEEIPNLVDDMDMLREAKNHLTQLAELKAKYEQIDA